MVSDISRISESLFAVSVAGFSSKLSLSIVVKFSVLLLISAIITEFSVLLIASAVVKVT